MGSAGLLFDAGDTLSSSRLAQKTMFVGTGAQIAALSPTYPGQKVYCTSTGSGFTADVFYIRNAANSSWSSYDLSSVAANPDTSVYPYSTTIGDYSSPVAALSGTALTMSSDDGSSETTVRSGAATRVAEKITDTNLRGRKFAAVTIRAAKQGAPTGTITINIRKTSDDSVVGTIGTIDIATLTTSMADYTVSTTIVTAPAEDFRITVEYGGGDASNYLRLRHRNSGSDYAGGVFSSYTPSVWTDQSTWELYLRVVHNGDTSAAANAIDGNTGTNYQSESIVNPALRLDLSGAATAEPAAIALWPHANNTVVQIKIQTSPDGSTWTDKRLINWSAFSSGAYNYLRFNRDTAQVRYLRIYGNDAGAAILAITEIKVILPTESQWNRRHGHKSISASDAGQALSA